MMASQQGNTCVTLLKVIEIRQYIGPGDKNYFEEWFNQLNAQAAAKVSTALARISCGNWSNVKGVGSSVYEYRINFGPGYRIYFGKEGDRIVILLAGGSKQRQQQDIENAHERWSAYKNARKAAK